MDFNVRHFIKTGNKFNWSGSFHPSRHPRFWVMIAWLHVFSLALRLSVRASSLISSQSCLLLLPREKEKLQASALHFVFLPYLPKWFWLHSVNAHIKYTYQNNQLVWSLAFQPLKFHKVTCSIHASWTHVQISFPSYSAIPSEGC